MWKCVVTVVAVVSLTSAALAGERKTPAGIPEHMVPIDVSNPVLTDGTTVPLSLLSQLKVKTAQPGDKVEFKVAEDVRWRDQVVISKGAVATAEVTTATVAKWPSKGSRLELKLSSLPDIDGSNVPVKADFRLLGGMNSVTNAAWALTAGTRELGLFFAPAAIVLSLTTKGRNANAPATMQLLATVDGDYPVKVRQQAPSTEPGVVWIGLGTGKMNLFCNGIPISQLQRKRVLRLELAAGYYRFSVSGAMAHLVYVMHGQEQTLVADFMGVMPIPADRAGAIKSQKPVQPERLYSTASSCTPLIEQNTPKQLLPEVIKSDVLIHQLGATGNEVGDIAKQ